MSALHNDVRERIRLSALNYPDRRAAVLPAIRLAQKELGFVTKESLKAIAEVLDVPEPEVYGTATFYSLIRSRDGGRHVISVCHNLPCTLMGAEALLAHLKNKLGVDEGQVTPDGRFSFQRIECIGRCDGAPAMLVDDDYHGELTPEKIDSVLERYR